MILNLSLSFDWKHIAAKYIDFKGSKMQSSSKLLNLSINKLLTHLVTSHHKRSIRSLCVDDPVSPPKSVRKREGTPYPSVAFLKCDRTVDARLLLEQCRKAIVREYPSIPHVQQNAIQLICGFRLHAKQHLYLCCDTLCVWWWHFF